MDDNLKKIDHTAIKVSQLAVIGLNLIAFVFNQPWLVALVASIMLLGTIFKVPGFGFIYHQLLKPFNLAKPEVLWDNPEPHRFAQGLGSALLFGGAALVFFGSLSGWALIWMVIALAALNAFAGFCAGCMLYYWLARLKVPGFHRHPPAGAFPGKRPNTPVQVKNES